MAGSLESPPTNAWSQNLSMEVPAIQDKILELIA